MKVVTLDLDKLLKEGKLTQAEYDKLLQLSSRTVTHLFYNVMLGFSVVAVSVATIALLPGPAGAIAIGLVICLLGIALSRLLPDTLGPLAKTCLVVGALIFGGGDILGSQGSVRSFFEVAIVWGAFGILARSQMLIALCVLALASCLGARTGYLHATYFVGIQEPLLTVLLFTPFAVITFRLAQHLLPDYQALAMAAARTGVFLVNFGFWVGSLWGDRTANGDVLIPAWIFAIAWALALAAAGYWAWRHNRRWLLTLATIFGAIHFYTQWFEHLKTTPTTILIGGLLGIAFALAFRALNARMKTDG
jgi:hypothetical protein